MKKIATFLALLILVIAISFVGIYETDALSESGSKRANEPSEQEEGSEEPVAQSINLDEGNGGEISPNNGVTESDVKKHWDMENGTKELVAILKWEDTTLGIGECPHSGEVYAEDNNGTEGNGEGEVVLTLDDEELLSQEGQWFVHISTKERTHANGGNHFAWESCSFTVEVIVYRLAENSNYNTFTHPP